MSWRIIQISSACKLDLKLNHMVIRGDKQNKVFIRDISVLIIENTAVSMTAALLCELNRQKVKIIFCDEKRNPYGELISYYGSHDIASKLKEQIQWDKHTTELIWTEIVKNKIIQQSNVLSDYGYYEHSYKLENYANEIQHNDSTNRESHAAKVYFNTLFGKDFSRKSDNPINSALNYGYSILISTFNREITISGYSTCLGIFHDNIFNPYNLGSDLMEPFRPLIDRCVFDMKPIEMNSEVKRELVDILNCIVSIDGCNNYLINAIRIYCKSIFNAINEKNIEKLRFYTYEDQIHESNGVL